MKEMIVKRVSGNILNFWCSLESQSISLPLSFSVTDLVWGR